MASDDRWLIRDARIVALTTPADPEPVDLLIERGRVTRIASRLEAPGARRLAADGRWLIPGLWDQHVHMAQWAQTRGRVDLSATRSPPEVPERFPAALPTWAAAVVIGFGYRSAGWSTQPTVSQLDAITGDRPVVLVSGDAHNGWLNSAALSLLGVAARDGVLDEAQWFPVWARLGELARDPAGEHTAYADAVRDAAGRGIVGITDMELADGVPAWQERFASGIDQLRVRIATYEDTLDRVLARGLRTGDPIAGTAGRAVMGPLKVITDGSLNTRTAYCCQPYADDPSNRGTLNISGAQLTDLMTQAHAHGLRVAAHAIGDAALTSALDAFTASGAHGSIEHAQLVALADVRRMADLGIIASVQPAHLLDDREVTHALWPDRTHRCFILRTMLRQGVQLALGSDAPVAPLDPWLAMAAAVHRSPDAREPWNAAESLTPAEALAASTDGAGAVALGSLADLVLLDRNPLQAQHALEPQDVHERQDDSAAAAALLRGLDAVVTMVGGRITHAEPCLDLH